MPYKQRRIKIKIEVVPLAEFLDGEGEEDTQTLLNTFQCSKGDDVQDFLHNHALDFNEKNLAKTFLVGSIQKGSFHLYGYFALTIKVVLLDARNISKTQIQKICCTKTPNDYNQSFFLIGQLGKNDYYGNQIDGKILMDLALSIINDAHQKIGGRYIMLECKNIPKLIEFYKKFGFRFLQKSNDNDLHQYIRKVN